MHIVFSSVSIQVLLTILAEYIESISQNQNIGCDLDFLNVLMV